MRILLESILKFEDIKTFSQINFLTLKNEINDKNLEIKNLIENNLELKKYREKLEEIKILLSGLNKKRDNIIWEISNLIKEVKRFETRYEYIKNILKNLNTEELKQKFCDSKFNFSNNPNLENINWKKMKFLKKLHIKKID